MADIGGIVEALIEAGTPPALAARLVAQAFQAGVEAANFRGHPVDEAAEKRRAYDRERKRKERNSTGLPPESAECPNVPLSSLKEDKNRKRGARLPPDWTPSSDDRAFAKQLGWSESQIDSEAANFRDYWIAKPGSGGCKLDWPATWRKWVRSSKTKPAGIPASQEPANLPGYYAKADSEQLAAWDAWGVAKRGKGMPRDKHGGWRVDAEWPPGYVRPEHVDVAAFVPKLRAM